jgi:hypothetical protein
MNNSVWPLLKCTTVVKYFFSNVVVQLLCNCTLIGFGTYSRGPGSSVGIATGYGLDGPVIEFR